MTKPEVALWRELRGRPGAAKFRRQYPIGPYVVDFYCLSARLLIAADGAAHGTGHNPHRDLERDRFIKENGYGVLGDSTSCILADVAGAAAAIVARARSPLHHAAHGPPHRVGDDK